MANEPNPFKFPVRDATIVGEASITITVHLRTGAITMTTSRPDMSFLAAIDLLAAQLHVLIRRGLEESARGNPKFSDPGSENTSGETSGGKLDS